MPKNNETTQNESNAYFLRGICRLKTFYDQLAELLFTIFDKEIYLSFDPTNKHYLWLCIKVEEILKIDDFANLSELEWRPFENLPTGEVTQGDLYSMVKDICYNFKDKVTELYIRAGEPGCPIPPNTLGIFSRPEIFSKIPPFDPHELTTLMVISLHINSLKKSKQNFVRYYHESKKRCIPPPPDFSRIIKDKKMIEILVERWEECNRCIGSSSYLSGIVLIGSILEVVLFEFARQNPRDANRSKSSPKDKSGNVKPLEEWTLENLINVALNCGWIQKDIEHFSKELRCYRNIVHPREQIKKDFKPDDGTFNLCLPIIIEVISDLINFSECMKKPIKSK